MLLAFIALGLTSFAQSDTSYYELDNNYYKLDSSAVKFYSDLLPTPNFLSQEGVTHTINAVPSQRGRKSYDSYFLIMLLVGVLGVVSLNLKSRKWSDVFSGMVKSANSVHYFREQRERYTAFQIVGMVFFAIVTGLFLEQNIGSLTSGSNVIFDLLLYPGLALAIYYSKYLFLKMIGSLLDMEELFDYIAFHLNIFAYSIGFLLIPVTFVYVCTEGLSHLISGYFFIGIFSLGYLVWMYRSINHSLSTSTRNFIHFIIYLCALEILPLLLWINLFTK